MSPIPFAEHLPGITGLLEYDKIAAKPKRELPQILLRWKEGLVGFVCFYRLGLAAFDLH